MKKLNVSEVSNVVGGANSCLISFENATVAGVTTCQQVTTCKGKYGDTVTRATADSSLCGVVTPPVAA